MKRFQSRLRTRGLMAKTCDPGTLCWTTLSPSHSATTPTPLPYDPNTTDGANRRQEHRLGNGQIEGEYLQEKRKNKEEKSEEECGKWNTNDRWLVETHTEGEREKERAGTDMAASVCMVPLCSLNYFLHFAETHLPDRFSFFFFSFFPPGGVFSGPRNKGRPNRPV